MNKVSYLAITLLVISAVISTAAYAQNVTIYNPPSTTSIIPAPISACGSMETIYVGQNLSCSNSNSIFTITVEDVSPKGSVIVNLTGKGTFIPVGYQNTSMLSAGTSQIINVNGLYFVNLTASQVYAGYAEISLNYYLSPICTQYTSSIPCVNTVFTETGLPNGAKWYVRYPSASKYQSTGYSSAIAPNSITFSTYQGMGSFGFTVSDAVYQVTGAKPSSSYYVNYTPDLRTSSLATGSNMNINYFATQSTSVPAFYVVTVGIAAVAIGMVSYCISRSKSKAEKK